MKEQGQQYNQIESSTRKRVEQEFPESEDEGLSALLASFNMGPKAVTQLLLPYNGYISPTDLRRGFREAFKGTQVADFSEGVPSVYCTQTLCRIGLVAREYLIEYFGMEKLVGFGLTEAGRRYGIPAACLALYFEEQHQQSLYSVFGSIKVDSPEQQRAPFTRAKILLALDQKEKLRELDICRELDINEQTTRNSLVALTKAGVVDYKSVSPHTGKTQVFYTKGKSPTLEAQSIGRRAIFRQEIVRCCEELVIEGESITQDTVFRKLSQERRDSSKSESGLRGTVNKILSGLANKGYLQRGHFKGKEVLSVAQITEAGKTVVVNFIAPLISFIQGDRNIDKEIVPKVLGNLNFYAQNSAELYYQYSLSFKKKQTKENISRLTDILSNSPKGLTVSELSERIGLNETSIRRYLGSMGGMTQKEERKGVYYYSVKPAE